MMYWQQEQRQQQGLHGRSSMQQMSPGWGPSPGISNRPSLLDMSGNLRNDPSLRSPSFGSNHGPSLGSSRGGGLLPSPSAGMRTHHDMLGQLDNDIDELVAAKVRLQQAMLSAAANDGRADRQQGFQHPSRPSMNQQRQPRQQQQYPQQDRRRNSSGGPMGRNIGGGARSGGGLRDGVGRTGGRGRVAGGGASGRGGRGGPGMGNRDHRSGGRGEDREQNMQRKRSNSEIYDPAKPTDDEVTSIGRPVDDLQVTIRQQSKGRAVTDEGGPARKKPMQSPRTSTNPTANIDMEAEKNSTWFCHVCSITCRDIKAYQTHMTGKKHLDAMDKIREVATFQSDQAKARLQAQNYLRKLENSGGSGGRGGEGRSGDQRSRQRYCRDCHQYFRGDRFDHVRSDAHKDVKRKSKPHCSTCDLSFKTTQKYVQHCKGDMHKRRREGKSKEESSKEESYVTVDAVGFDDDNDLDAELIDLQLESQGDDDLLDATSSEEGEDAVIIIDSGNDKSSEDKEDVDQNTASIEDMPKLEPMSEDETLAKEGIAQVSTSELIDDTSGSKVPDVQVIEATNEEPAEAPMEVQESTTNKAVAICPEGPDADSKSGLDNLKVTLTFENQPLSDTKSASAIPENDQLEVHSADANVSSGGSEMVAVMGSENQAEDQASAKQVESEQTESSKVGRESKESTAMDVDPASGVSAPPEEQQEKQQQQDDIVQLIFDPNKSVGEEYLVPVSGFFCKLCHKFLTSDKASRVHCKGKSHFQAVKAALKKTKSVDESDEPNGQANK
ncbi:uncharacterized protein LOC110981566 isoform X2 [Acanthaster planci]|uniref:Uncharacterized protein LOC110981566 isoform X2 n=1 Tax=Acanthaster planci TaxID=133434 RepID=A0A8B7YU92_ACAPL|nr:uncharacterized protein LOC110981566 isoform X2 [Acanthaster planci]